MHKTKFSAERGSMNIKESVLSQEHPQEDKSRLGGYSYVYSDMTEREYSCYLKLVEAWAAESDEVARSNIEDRAFEAGVKATIFAALSVEAAINDYAAWQLGDSFFDSHLSSLDVMSKWVVIPKLVCGKTIDKSGPAYSALRQLIKARNELVHNKSRHLDPSDPDLALKLGRRTKSFESNVVNAYRAVVLLSLTMDNLLGSRFNPLRSFNKEINLCLDIPDNVLDIVNECRRIIGKNNS